MVQWPQGRHPCEPLHLPPSAARRQQHITNCNFLMHNNAKWRMNNVRLKPFASARLCNSSSLRCAVATSSACMCAAASAALGSASMLPSLLSSW